jgi:hypothetical protein
MYDFFTAKDIDDNMRRIICEYIDKFKCKDARDLVERDNFNNHLVCPFCRTAFPDYSYFLRHFRFYKHRWEMRLLKRIFKYGPRNLQVFDGFYKKDGFDYELEAKVKFWVLALKIFEGLDIMPWPRNPTELATKSYVDRIFWEKDREFKEELKK